MVTIERLLCALYTLFLWMLVTTPGSRCYYPHFIDKKWISGVGGQIIRLRSSSQYVAVHAWSHHALTGIFFCVCVCVLQVSHCPWSPLWHFTLIIIYIIHSGALNHNIIECKRKQEFRCHLDPFTKEAMEDQRGCSCQSLAELSHALREEPCWFWGFLLEWPTQ